MPARDDEPRSPAEVLPALMEVIRARKAERPEKSYVVGLLDGGLAKIGAKIAEEAGELVEAAGEQGDAGRAHTVREAADLLFHVLVLLGWAEIRFEEVEAELRRRFGIGGLQEKASRPK